jgi:uncharacterized membrane protein HdeD (DUF308 family)
MASSEVIRNETMWDDLSHNWGWMVVRGIAAVCFGVLALLVPGVTIAVLVLLWGAYALADGILSLISAFRIRDRGRPFWALLAVGILGIGAGILTFAWPAITALVLLAFIAGWALFVGVLQIVAAVRLRKSIEHEWLLGISGALSVVFGALMLISPGAGALAVLWMIGAYAIAFGALLIALGFKLRSHTHHHHPRFASQH